jgi:N-succinyldiaminopimelate aminotransferase
VVFSSLSKRSNVPGMRSGFVAGDADVIEKFALYRTYHGSAMNPAIQAASIAAWNDEAHVAENRRLYAEKFSRVVEILKPVLPVKMPDAGFYLWVDLSKAGVRTPVSDTAFAQALYRDYNVTVLPGSYLARTAQGVNPGENFVRMALVASTEETVEAAQRIAKFIASLE